MRTMCLKCNKVRETNKDLIEGLNKIIEDGQPSSPFGYLKILNVTSGKCTNNEDHNFVYNIEDSLHVKKLLSQNIDADGRLMAKELEKEKVSTTIDQLKQKLEEYENRLSQIPKEKEELQKEKEDVLQKFETLTGTQDVNFWGEEKIIKKVV